MLSDRISNLELKYENLHDMVSLIDQYSRHMTSQMWTMLGIFLTLFLFIMGGAAYFLIKNLVDARVNKEIDKRLLTLINNNPTIFHTVGSGIPDEENKIYLNPNILGIDQLLPDRVLSLQVRGEEMSFDQLFSGASDLIPILRINGNGLVEMEIMNYVKNNGKVYWQIIWPRVDGSLDSN
ncbi:hypothetical protein V4V35_23775 [Bacillus infantis]|uniref:hypothetical protein n=1 Tax=Bacillus infantis TaxID=324767 RepID=UPI002FBD767E